MENGNEKMLQICIHEYLMEKGMHDSARVFREQIGLQDDDLANHPGLHFLRDWWNTFYDAYSSRHLNPSSSMQNALPEFQQQLPVTMQNSDLQLNFPRGHWQQSPQFPHQDLARDQMFDVGVGRPNPLSSRTQGMLSDIVGSTLVPTGGLPSIDQNISNPVNFVTPGLLDSSQPIVGLSRFGSSLMPLSELPIANPPMFSTHGMPNYSPQPIAGLSSSGSSLVMVKNMSSEFGQLMCCDFSSEGDILACITQDQKMVIWNTMSNRFVPTPESQHRSPIMDVRFVPNTTYIATSSLDKLINLWDANKPSETLNKIFPTGTIFSMDFNAKNLDQLCCADKDEIRLWSISQSTHEIFFQGAARQVRFRPGEVNMLAALFMVNEIGLFDVETKSHLFSLKGHEEAVHTICWDASGQYIASVSEDEACIWAINYTIYPIHVIKSKGKRFYSCTAHPQFAQAFVIGSHQSLEVWNPNISNTTESIYAHNGIVSALCTSSKAGLIASTSNDNCVKLWRTTQMI